MSMTRSCKLASVLLVAGATASGANLLAQKKESGAATRSEKNSEATRAYDGPVYEVKPGKFNIDVTAPGALEAARSEDLYCLVEGQTTIIMIKPEGTRVKKGELVCQLDSASLNDQLVNQQITTKSAEANHENAKLTREVAEIAVRQYTEGIFVQELATAEGEIKLAQSGIARAEGRLERMRRARQRMNEALAANPGARPVEIMADLDLEDRLEAAALAMAREKFALEQATAKKQVLQQYTRGKTTRELQSEVERRRSDELAKEATWTLQRTREEKLERQIAACKLVAPIDGLVVYANDPNRAFGSNQPQIEEGATVRERQKIVSIPDITRMQVNTKVDESQIDKIAPNMKARIRVTAFADQVLNGRILDVAPLPDSTNFFSSDVKVYTTKVAIAGRLPGLRPLMTARVEIFDERDNVLGVPLQAVLHYEGKDHVAVKKPDGGFEFRAVTVGPSDGKLVEVRQGIQPGDRVALNPAALMSEEERLEKLDMPSRPTAPAKARAKGARAAGLSLFAKLRNVRPEDRPRLKSASPEERAEILKKAGFSDEEVQQFLQMMQRFGNPGGAGGGRPGGRGQTEKGEEKGDRKKKGT
jgi:HlyD family secretion protein